MGVMSRYYNQGEIYDFEKDAFLDGCEKVIERVRQNKKNEEGTKLQSEFTYKKTTDKIIEALRSI